MKKLSTKAELSDVKRGRKTRVGLQALAVAVAGLSTQLPLLAADTQPADLVLLSTNGSERATTGLGNKIVSFGDKSHAVWLDVTATGYVARAASLDHKTGKWSPPVTLGMAFDNHSRPCITVDRKGTLHVVISGHNTPYIYLKSVRPNDGSEWTKPAPFAKGTYPSITVGPEDSLWLSGRPATLSGIDIYRKSATNTPWKLVFPHALKREPKYKGYGGYNSILAWGPGARRLHFACDIYEGPTNLRRGEHQAIVYMVSDDQGLTWKRSDGSAITGEHFATNLDAIAVSVKKRGTDKADPVLRLGGMVVDSRDRPIILYTADEPEVGQARLITPADGGGWKELGLSEALRKHQPDYGALGAGGALTQTARGVLQMCIPLALMSDMKNPATKKIKPADFRYVWVETPDGGKTYSFRNPIPSGDGMARFAPTLERDAGINQVAASGRGTGMMFFTGLQRYAKEDEYIQNLVYYVEMK